jgi:hypothetical protein
VPNKRNAIRVILATLVCGMAGSGLAAQSYNLPSDLQASIASHQHVRQLTDWGSRPDWSADSKKLLFVSKEYGDLFELDIATGRTRPLTFHFPHAGIFRGYYLPNGDILFMAPRQHDPDFSTYGRFFESELWVLKGDLSEQPVRLDIKNFEGVAAARDTSRIAWAQLPGPLPARKRDDEFNLMSLGRPDYQIWIADIGYEGGNPTLLNKRMILQCDANTGPLIPMTTAIGQRCGYLEPQNFIPGTDDLLFSMATAEGGDGYRLNITTGEVIKLTGDGYNELEGVFPSGRYAALEHVESNPGETVLDETKRIDLWRIALDSSAEATRMTFFHQLDPRLKSNQGVISPDGNWMAFGVSTGEVEMRVSGQGIGLFLMDLRAAGFN